ncbi:type VII secretion protein EccB [Kitasatospora camelliae]|uniref:Type VII secretion protein EccB n=1 Tax=Kitasatospora camelliae TaxID=3156397 RepID=A0AAU8JWH9_9ACTN
MASRRDELNAYTFARKRTVGAFLQPGGGGNDEDAPRPVRAVLPSFVIGAVIVAGFGMWGVIKPAAPVGWDEGKFIIQGKQSTTRYVVLKGDNGEKVLHQVLNMSSARLVLPANAQVKIVADDVLDKYKNHGPTIGIPYAPDKLPKQDDAGKAKLWSVCDRPGEGKNITQAVFVAADKDREQLTKPELLMNEGQSLFVEAPVDKTEYPASWYLIDSKGLKHAVGTLQTSKDDRNNLATALFGAQATPEKVTGEWLKTLDEGGAIDFPVIPGTKIGDPSKASGVPTKERKVGRLMKYDTRFFVVGSDAVFEISEFQSDLLSKNPALKLAYGQDKFQPAELNAGEYAELSKKVDVNAMKPKEALPTKAMTPLNTGPKGDRTVICSTFEGVDKGVVKRSVWAHTAYPVAINSGSTSAYVTPGHGLLFRAVENAAAQDSSGTDFLITETGLRYSLPANGDGGAKKTDNGASPAPQQPQSEADKQEANEAQARLGYKGVTPSVVPKAWTDLVPAGPVLNTKTAVQAQNV